jgi:AraC-like DNA-binding protein
MFRRADLTDELENLLGRPLRKRLEFVAGMDVTTPGGRSWATATQLAMQELKRPDGMLRHPLAARAVETTLIGGLLFGQSHSYTEELNAPALASSNAAIRRAVELLEDQPERPWSAGSLARAVLLSVRSLHEGFRRDVGIPPLSYLKQVRLRCAHHDLVVANDGTASVRALFAGGFFTTAASLPPTAIDTGSILRTHCMPAIDPVSNTVPRIVLRQDVPVRVRAVAPSAS